MSESNLERGIPLAPTLERQLTSLRLPERLPTLNRRVAVITALSMLVAIAAALGAQALTRLIAFITNVAFHQRLDVQGADPSTNRLGLWVIAVPVVGGLVVGAMARFGSRAIRGHGIPEAMEQILLNDAKIPKRMTLLKPISAAIAIGTGGPFGAEGPIIATGGALGSTLGQLVPVTSHERKTLLAAGAAAGMAATFGSPVSAVLLAIELLLFEYRSRSLVPVALAACVATAVRFAFVGSSPIFPMESVQEPGAVALTTYVVLGAFIGVCSVAITRLLYAVEDGFERLPIAWPWWPAIGGLAVGVIGYFAPRTLGVGYVNIEETLRGDLLGSVLLTLCVAKLASWLIALGSGTSGGTLAPLFTIGGALGALSTRVVAEALPGHQIDPRIGALVGMAAMFAGASRALLASVVFAFECTRQPIGLLPLLGACTAAYFVSGLMMPNTIMTEKLARRGVRVGSQYGVDDLELIHVGDIATRQLVTIDADITVADARTIAAGSPHQVYPVTRNAELLGIVASADLKTRDGSLNVHEIISSFAVAAYPDHTAREAADHMLQSGVGRIVVISTGPIRRPIGIVTRRDILAATKHTRPALDREPALISSR
ncbi:MAG: chloride channel protein [Polyangiaceae bacterium]